ncbi:MAG: siderophore ABC transporter substrate-binding protein [Neisseria sp.]|uniref:siderophore ABC transporter substrate-binding protein n=1 Tax=Neisseria sp. TaxID=192066 RepID=UPI0026DC9F09|nr:siderophore ABC transporter substrate-binding protein [Neisseria sp.]MDO4642095.1 siderophore ABC transporter substrate-binding protein [Neisseria sp.]
MKFRFSALSLCLTALVACSPQSNQNTNPSSAPASGASASASAPAAAQPTGETVTIETARGSAQVPKNPQRIAVYDLGMLDTLDALGVHVDATVEKLLLPNLEAAHKDRVKVGTLFDPNYEALNAFKPDLIVIGSRTAKAFDQLNAIAPTIEMTADTKNMRVSAESRIDAFAKVFGKEKEAEALKAKIDATFKEAKAAAEGKGKGLVILANAGKVSAFGQDSRFGWIHKDVGVPVADSTIKEGTHGQPASFEYIKQVNPDWLFVLDRSAAIGQGDASTAAQKVLDNPLVRETNAWKKGQVVYLLPSNYLAAGGAQQLIDATTQVSDALKAAK